MSNDLICKFLNQFGKVFNTDFTINTCGREACSKLIDLASQINQDVDFGNSDTGVMNTEAIIELYKEVA